MVRLSPASLQHVFFTLGGSDAVDSAVRYAIRRALGRDLPGFTFVLDEEVLRRCRGDQKVEFRLAVRF